MEETNKLYHMEVRASIQILKRASLAILDQLADEDTLTKMQGYAQLQKNQHQSLGSRIRNLAVEATEESRQLTNSLTSLESAARTNEMALSVLDKLYFSEIPRRAGKIEKKHETTLEWIFNDGSVESGQPDVYFVEWLRSIDSVFWVLGKPGSGKSTLFKYLSWAENTKDHLRGWATGGDFLIARFFFWAAGTPLQKSREGLLRSLIFDLLRQSTSLLDKTVREVLEGALVPDKQSQFSDVDYLLKLYEYVVNQASPSKICLFIDGLDEFQEPGKALEDLLVCLRSLRLSSQVKMCVSSRPWEEFVVEFADVSERHTIKMEDLTRDDIRRYITDKFNSHHKFPSLVQNDPSYCEFVEKIVNRIAVDAQGVFLWVHLVVEELLKGLTFDDSVSELEDRLKKFPSDLADFFLHIMQTIPENYRRQTARYFKVTLRAPRQLGLRLYSFLDDLDRDADFAFKLETKPMEPAELRRMEHLARTRIVGRSRGLLECRDSQGDVNQELAPIVDLVPGSQGGVDPCLYSEPVVDFLHRTVRDFLLESAEGQAALYAPLGPNDRTALMMCHAILAEIKTSRTSFQPTSFKSDHLQLLDTLFYFVRDFSPEDSHTPHVLQAEDPDSRQMLIYTVLVAVEDAAADALSSTASDFIGMGCRHEVLWYVKKRLAATNSSSDRRKLLNPPRSRKALDYALCGQIKSVQQRIDCVNALLCAGASPNADSEDSTVWGQFASRLDARETNGMPEDFIRTVTRMLLMHGADTSVVTSVPMGSLAPARSGVSGRADGLQRAQPLHGKKPLKVRNITAKEVLQDRMGEAEAKMLLRETRWTKRAARALLQGMSFSNAPA
jgi:hypothetical protein